MFTTYVSGIWFTLFHLNLTTSYEAGIIFPALLMKMWILKGKGVIPGINSP